MKKGIVLIVLFGKTLSVFMKAIAEGKQTKGEYATFEDGLKEMIFCEKAIQSAKEGRWVKM